jgi:hypothetical protein
VRRAATVLTALTAAGALLLTTPAAADPGTPPVAVADEVTVLESESVTISPLSNDEGALDAAAVTVVEEPTSGSLLPDETNPRSLVFRSEPGFVGTVSFTYTFTDSVGQTPTEPGVVTVRVEARPPSAVDDAYAVGWGQTRSLTVLANDTDPYADPLVITALGEVAPTGAGTATIASGGTAITFAAGSSYTGTATLSYTVTATSGRTAEATVRIALGPAGRVVLNQPPASVALRTYTLTGTIAGRPLAGAVVRVEGRRGTLAWQSVRPLAVAPDGRISWTYRPLQAETVSWRAVVTWPDGYTATSGLVQSMTTARADIVISGKLTRAALSWSWRPGCPRKPSDMRRMDVTYWTYRGTLARGSIVAARWAVRDIAYAFDRAFTAGFRFKKLTPAAAYYAGGTRTSAQSDIYAMADDNTSAFNCRKVTGNRYRWSRHAFGDAIDVNPFRNPYVTWSTVYPRKARIPSHVRRAENLSDPGVLTRRSALTKAFLARGWSWGGYWTRKDYQHFSLTGG